MEGCGCAAAPWFFDRLGRFSSKQTAMAAAEYGVLFVILTLQAK
jgi:hypothetical protein